MALSEQDKQEILDMVSEAIAKNVNGKIDVLSKKVEPMTDMLATWSHIKAQAMFWMGGMLAMGGAISALQTVWSFISPHIKS